MVYIYLSMCLNDISRYLQKCISNKTFVCEYSGGDYDDDNMNHLFRNVRKCLAKNVTAFNKPYNENDIHVMWVAVRIAIYNKFNKVDKKLVSKVYNDAPDMFKRCNNKINDKFFEDIVTLCYYINADVKYSDDDNVFDVGQDIIYDDRSCSKQLKKIRAYLQDCIYNKRVEYSNEDISKTAYMYNPAREPEFYDRILLNVKKDLYDVVKNNGFKEAYVYQEWYTIKLLAENGFQVGGSYVGVRDIERYDPEEWKKCIYPNQDSINFSDVLSSIDNIMQNVCTSELAHPCPVPCSLMGL